MGVIILGEAIAACRAGGIRTPARFILCLLADKAKDRTRLAWPAHALLAEISGLSPNAVADARSALERAGMISVWRRSGKVPLYLMHPLGLSELEPFDRSAMMAHLRDGNFRSTERDAASEWRAALQLECEPAAQPEFDLDPPTTWGGVDCLPPHQVRPYPPHHVGPTPPPRGGHPPTTWDRTRREPERNPNPFGRPGRAGRKNGSCAA